MTPDGVIELNREILNPGEPHQLLDRGLLESACARPKNHWHYNGVDDVEKLATLLLFAIAENHAFLQGNKRTGFAAMVGFLGANGFRFDLSDDAACADDILATLQQQSTPEAFEDRLRRAIVPVDTRSWRS
ncbi:MAG TPA: type II toxin-antitoxin system death-on-curing family toxin [Caulobacteraceae bacterium]